MRTDPCLKGSVCCAVKWTWKLNTHKDCLACWCHPGALLRLTANPPVSKSTSPEPRLIFWPWLMFGLTKFSACGLPHSSQGFLPEFPKGVRLSTGGHMQRIQRGGAHHPWSLTVLESQDRWEMVWDNERKMDCGVRPTRLNFSFCHLLGVVVGSWGCQEGQRRHQGWLPTLQHLQALKPLVYHTLS